MKILPAIDIKDGICVRLAKGDYSKMTKYNNDPVDVAGVWVKEGAENIHIVDLDGARSGETNNFSVIKKIREQFPDIFIQVGGGIRSKEDIEKYLNIGINKLIIGTKALSDPDFLTMMPNNLKDKLIIDIAIKDEKLVVHGWENSSSHSIDSFLVFLENQNIHEIVFTDVDRDGMLDGINFLGIKSLASKTKIPVIASGGITSTKDIQKLSEIRDIGISGIIIGKALYEKKFRLSDAIRVLS